ncbi:ankyrin repeat and SAM domain-containing protein 3 isoform X2 [Brienomyrus brachyistius]|uniref:ankyrin repeat and SAM domain-containing protein 3 isoform X2 n=1 Tax=Brienomyrus brachyistius TaxID=42636 RepID=UPI0020B1D2F5|nr:ankyrin repeat and SAM domain-containing protein 3 isoform X2 [Brienomyrus brachyistius]
MQEAGHLCFTVPALDTSRWEPISEFTLLMEAAASGHEIIGQYLLEHGVKVNERNAKGETARSLAILYGHTKIASLIDMQSARTKQGHYEDLSSSEDSDSAPRRSRLTRSKGQVKGPSIHDGPQAIAKFRVGAPSRPREPRGSPAGYVTFRDTGEQSEGICNRDVTSPINELDGQSNSSRDESPFFDHDMHTMRSSSGSSSDCLPRMVGLSREASLESNEDSDQAKKSSARRVGKGHHHKGKSRHSSTESAPSGSTGNCGGLQPSSQSAAYTGPKDLAEFLEQIGFSKYLPLLEEQDIDLRIFLTLTENDLKEVGITLFGPKRKMTSAIARWHSRARPPSDALEQAYADQLEAEMQEMAIQLHKRCEEVESLQAQVLQERELRTVMEGCLMEDKVPWRRVHAELVETHRLAQELSSVLDTVRTCQMELFSRLPSDGVIACCDEGLRKLLGETDGKGNNVLEDFKSLSLSELVLKLDAYETEMGKTVHMVTKNLKRLSAAEKLTQQWES